MFLCVFMHVTVGCVAGVILLCCCTYSHKLVRLFKVEDGFFTSLDPSTTSDRVERSRFMEDHIVFQSAVQHTGTSIVKRTKPFYAQRSGLGEQSEAT